MTLTRSATLDSLPNELLFEIALRVEDSALSSLFRVSHQWADLSSDELFWKRRCDYWFPRYLEKTLFDIRSTPSWREKYQFIRLGSVIEVYAKDVNYLIIDEPCPFYWSH
jgi:hypothetical protein